MFPEPWRDRLAWEEAGVLIDMKNTSPDDYFQGEVFDVIIVGSGAGGGVAASRLAQAGLKVLILESGGLFTAKDFSGDERLYASLYKNGLLDSTSDNAINLLQGHCVGGSATVNWTSSFRLPDQTLHYWRDGHGVDLDLQLLSEAYDVIEKKLNVQPWSLPPNRNNQVIATGARTLGWQHGVVPRNVKGCWDLGLCGLGCPVNAKQSPLVTTIPEAIKSGALLAYNCPVDRVLHDGGRVFGVVSSSGLRIASRYVALAAGAINSPGILLRSHLSDLLPEIGRRTCLHPSCFSMARFSSSVRPYYGAPQSVYSDQFLWPKSDRSGFEPMGYKLEAIPLQPVLASGLFARSGLALAEDMAALKDTQGMIALIRDGFGADSGGNVVLDKYGVPRLEYPHSKALKEAAVHALGSMAECQFSAGALAVRPCHLQADQWFDSVADVKRFLKGASYERYQLGLGSAHLMGGAAMGLSAKNSVVDGGGRVHGIDGLSIVDGSVFPTSLGVNPQLTVMAFSLLASNKIKESFESVN